MVPVNETQENRVPSPVGVKRVEQRIVWGGTLLFAHGVPSPLFECRDSTRHSTPVH